MSTIAEEITALNTNLAAAKAAVAAAGGTVGDTGLAGLASEIATIPSGGGGGVAEKDINFYDYDGTLVESWTLAELANKTALPANPTHAGLTAQGWNWTLADLKTENAKMNVGQMYIPTDGKTHLFVEVDADHLTPNLSIGLNGSATLDWGDGTTPDEITGSSENTGVATFHTYAAAGSYEVTIALAEGSYGRLRGTASYVSFLWKGDFTQTGITTKNLAYAYQVKEIHVGDRMSFGLLPYLCGLEKITLPHGSIRNASDASYTFYDNRKLGFIVIPDDTTELPRSFAENCYGLKGCSLPKLSVLNADAFKNCYSLDKITIPSSVTTIIGAVFTACYAMKNVPQTDSSVDFIGMAEAPQFKTIEIREGITTVRGMWSCNSLESVTLPSTVQTIANVAFQNCISLRNINFPKTITAIGANAFYGCSSLWNLDFSDFEAVPTIGSSVFLLSEGAIIKVPAALEADWKAAQNWSTYANYIVGV